jgi:hypothetical protein
VELVQCPHELYPGRHRNSVYISAAGFKKVVNLLFDSVLSYLEMRFSDIGDQGIDCPVELSDLIPFELPDRLDPIKDMAPYRLGVIFPGVKELDSKFICGIAQPVENLLPLQLISLHSILRGSAVIVADTSGLLIARQHQKGHPIAVERSLIAGAPRPEMLDHALGAMVGGIEKIAAQDEKGSRVAIRRYEVGMKVRSGVSRGNAPKVNQGEAEAIGLQGGIGQHDIESTRQGAIGQLPKIEGIASLPNPIASD